MTPDEARNAQITVGAVFAKEIDIAIERTLSEFDAANVVVNAIDALEVPIFIVKPHDARTRDILDGLKSIRISLSRKPIPDVAAALERAVAITDSAKAGGTKEILAQAYFALGLCYTALPFEDDSDRQEENQVQRNPMSECVFRRSRSLLPIGWRS